MEYDVFISYSRKDYVDENKQVIPGNVISRIKELFDANGISYWFDEDGFLEENPYAPEIIIRTSKLFLFISSEYSNNSKSINRQLTIAKAHRKTIILLRLDDSPIDAGLVHLDFYYPSEQSLCRMMDFLNTQLYYLTPPCDTFKTEPDWEEEPKYKRQYLERKSENTCCRPDYDECVSRPDQEDENGADRPRSVGGAILAGAGAVIGGVVGGIFTLGAGIGTAVIAPFSALSGFVKNRIQARKEEKLENFRSAAEIENCNVYSSVFAPKNVRLDSHMQVRVFLHLFEESASVKAKVKECDENAIHKGRIPLSLKLEKGDKVDLEFKVSARTVLAMERKTLIWQGYATNCTFDFYVPDDIKVRNLSCAVYFSVNSIPVGEVLFTSDIVKEESKQVPQELIAHKFNKVFISYAHMDEEKVKFLAEGFKLQNVDHFFDRDYLKPGDIFPQKIQEYIDEADLFILCWSKNAVGSDYIMKERTQALGRAYPQVSPVENAKLSIYPLSIAPQAELPDDMKDSYHFGKL